MNSSECTPLRFCLCVCVHCAFGALVIAEIINYCAFRASFVQIYWIVQFWQIPFAARLNTMMSLLTIQPKKANLNACTFDFLSNQCALSSVDECVLFVIIRFNPHIWTKIAVIWSFCFCLRISIASNWPMESHRKRIDHVWWMCMKCAVFPVCFRPKLTHWHIFLHHSLINHRLFEAIVWLPPFNANWIRRLEHIFVVWLVCIGPVWVECDDSCP